ncbi:MAG: TIGR00282 family metallophosphoesterase [FCB group bacterium]|jgi:metallophosphoesterase (TIGR00282 family)|nr:TIGR00282 family metallophosphoesterase [FCB group bacterium]
MNILFIGDIVGRPGREIIARLLPGLREELALDAVVANAENAAGGLGATPEIIRELMAVGVTAVTLGNHTWRKKELAPSIESFTTVVRPANFPPGNPGRGSVVVNLPDGRALGVVNLLGRVYMEAFEDPFRVGLEEVERLRMSTPVVLVDMHAEATSEKVAMGWHLDGRASAVLGTHTHVQTADERVLPAGTAYITDVGMTGPRDSVIGTNKEIVLQKFITGMPVPFEVARGPAMLCAVLVEVEDQTGRAVRIERIARM